jgi:hypothetical protein
VAKTRDTRLARLATDETQTGSAKARDRSALSALAAVCALVRERLVQAEIDPARVGALRLAPPADPLPPRTVGGKKASGVITDDQPARSPGDGAGEEFVASDSDSLAGIFAEKLGEMARRYEDGSEPAFGNASLAELLAWCLAKTGVRTEDGV